MKVYGALMSFIAELRTIAKQGGERSTWKVFEMMIKGQRLNLLLMQVLRA